MGLHSCSSASLQDYKDAHAAASDKPRALRMTLSKVTGTRAGAQPTRSGCTGANSGQKTGPSRGPKNGAAKWTQFLQYNLKLNIGVVKPRPQNWGHLAAPILGPRILLFLGSSHLALSTRGPQTSAQSGNLRTTTAAGSFLVEEINMRETCTGAFAS